MHTQAQKNIIIVFSFRLFCISTELHYLCNKINPGPIFNKESPSLFSLTMYTTYTFATLRLFRFCKDRQTNHYERKNQN